MAKKVIKIIPTKVGTAYSPTYAYQLLDYIVIDSVTVYICKRVDPNTMTSVGHPLTDTDWWDKGVDLSEAIDKAQMAISKAQVLSDKVTEAEKSRESAEKMRRAAEAKRVDAEMKRESDSASSIEKVNAAVDNANDTASHPTKVGSDNYVYTWNSTTKEYDKTDIYVKGDKGEQGMSPKIIEGTWWLYNDEKGAYYNSGVSVSSAYELTKAKVENVLTGNITTHTHDQYALESALANYALASNLTDESDRAKAEERALRDIINVINGSSEVEGSFRKAISDLIGGAPEALDTLKEIADKLAEDDTLHATIQDAITKKADKDEMNRLLSTKANTADVGTKFTEEKKRVDGELAKKFDKESVAQESGKAEDKVMSQKAVSDKLSDLSEMDKNLNNSINKTHERQKYLANVFEGIKAISSNESGTFKDGIITVGKGNTFFEFFSSIHVEAYKGYMLIGKITALQDIESEKFEVYIGGDNYFDFTGRICKFVANSRNSKDYILQLGIINSTTDGKQFKVDYIYMIPQILYYEGIFDDLEAGIYTAYKSLTSVDAQEQKKIQELLNTKFNKEIKNNRLLSSQNYLQGFNILKGFDFENASSVIGKQTISDYIITIENNDTADRFNLEDFIGDKDINNYGFVAKITALQGNNPPVYPVLKGESTKTFGFNKDNACYIDFKTEKEGSLLGFGIGVFPSDELRVGNKYRIDFLFIIPQELIYDGLAKDISENKPVSYRAVGTETLLKKDIDSINGDITNIKNQLSREDETSYKCYCWGDSLTWGAGSSHSYAHYLNQLNLGVKFVTCGVGGEGSDAISFRQGANAGYLTKNITIPSTLDKIDLGTSFIRLDFGTPGILLQGEGRVDEAGIATVNPININGIDCTLSFDTSTSGAQFGQYGTDHYKLNRVDVGNEVTIKAGTLVTLAGNKFKNCYMNIYWVGTNDDGLPASDLLTRIEKMIDYNGNGRYLVIGFHTSIESGLSIIQERNKTLKDRFGNRFIDELSYMVNCGIDDALSRGYITGSYPREEDAAAISKNVVPPVFLHDAIHYNEIGYHLIADKIAERIKVLGLNLA